MSKRFQGFIKDVKYQPKFLDKLQKYQLDGFDINETNSSGIIVSESGEIGIPKWVSPKRTRSYPFERIYKTYGLQKSITIIPILKDEGIDGDCDYIQFSTFSWMNLLNIYVVLAYYDNAIRGGTPSKSRKITKQTFNNEFAKSQIQEILAYKQSALHWNRSLIEESFTDILRLSFEAYDQISAKLNIKMHARNESRLIGNSEDFKSLSLKASAQAAHRETLVQHALEHIKGDDKAILEIENYLGGTYVLTADRVYLDNDVWVIQESKNSTRGFPSASDIRDGLFKLILFSNLDTLMLDGAQIPFKSRLHLTGVGVIGSLLIPCTDEAYQSFLKNNKFSKQVINLLDILKTENKFNNKIEMLIEGNL